MELTLFDGRILKGQITRISNGIDRITKYAERLNRKYNKKAYNELNEMARDAIDEFYEDNFSPGRYRRTHSLHHAYKVYTTDNSWELLLGPEFMRSKHRAPSSIIYYNSLVVGVHGGAWRGNEGIDDYYWRMPHPDYTEWWPDPAPRGPENIEQKILDKAEEIISDLENQLQTDFDTYATKIIDDLNAGLKQFL